MCTYKYKDENGNEVVINISLEVSRIVEDEAKFERRIRDEYKAHITDLPDGQYEALPSMENIEETVIMRESLRDIFAIVSGCTEKQQRRFMLHIVRGYKVAEIAQYEGCTTEVVRRSIQLVVRKIVNNL